MIYFVPNADQVVWGRRRWRCCCCCCCCCRCCCCCWCCCTEANISEVFENWIKQSVVCVCALFLSFFTPQCLQSHTHTHSLSPSLSLSHCLLRPAHAGSVVKNGGCCLPPTRAGHPIEQMKAISVGNDEDSQRSTSSTRRRTRTSGWTPASNLPTLTGWATVARLNKSYDVCSWPIITHIGRRDQTWPSANSFRLFSMITP